MKLIFSFFIILIHFKITLSCYIRCLTCEGDSNEENPNCESCATGYHFIKDRNDKKCYLKSEIGEDYQNYYYNVNSEMFEKCHERCLTCKDGNAPTDDNNQCNECKEGLYKKITGTIGPDNCYHPYEIENNYYKDTSSSTIVFRQCYEKCNTCSQAGDDDNNNCDSCKFGTNSGTQYYKLDSEDAGNCYLIGQIPEGYEIPLVEVLNEIATGKINERNEITSQDNANYAYIYERIATRCYENCKTCTTLGNDAEMNCLTCIDNYFFYNNNCYRKCPKPGTYQLKESNYQCRELVEGYKIETDYRTSNDIIDFLLFHGLEEFDFEKDLITGDKIFGQVYSIKNKNSNDELSEQLKLSKISISDGCLKKIVDYYNLEEDIINDLMIIKFDRNYTDSNSKYISSVNQVDFYLFFPYYKYDLISGDKILNGTFTEIQLSICKDEEIKIIKPLINTNEALIGVNLTEALEIHQKNNLFDVFLSSNIFFSDICSTFKSNSNKDIELAERREKYFQNISFCEGNCNFSGFDYENYKINCDCDASLFLTSEQYKNNNFKDRKNLIKNLTISTLSNQFPENISNSFVTLNFKTMKCTHLIFDKNIAIKNIGNWIAVVIFLAKVVFLGLFLRKRFIPINEEHNKRKKKIEQEFLIQIPNAQIITKAELAKIPKYHIDKVIWGYYAGSYKQGKTLKYNNKHKHNNKDNLESNKLTSNELLTNKNNIEDTGNEKEESNKKKHKKSKNNPPKRLGYIYTDDRENEEQEQGENFKGLNQAYKNALNDFNYPEKEKNTSKFFENVNKKDFANAIFPLSKENLNNTEDENEKNTNIYSVKKSTHKKRKKRKEEEKKEQNDLIPIDIDNNDGEIKEKISQEENLNNQKEEENNNDNNNKNDLVGEEEVKTKNKKKSKKKKAGHQNYIEEYPNEVSKYKKEYLDDKNIKENPYKVEPAINFRFSTMASPEKLAFMKFNIAVNLDKRTFIEIYMGCVKMSQIIMNIIYIPYFHNMKFLKLFFLIFVINLNVFTTTIFYSHYYMGKMYGYKILICCLQSIFVSCILYLFSYSKKKFTSIHVLDIWKLAYYKKVYISIIICAIIFEFIFSAFIWFFSSAFNSVYQNSHIYYFLHILESNIITLGLPFIFCFLPAFLRYMSLSFEKKILFYISDYIDIIF